jgi:hypothetical protein
VSKGKTKGLTLSEALEKVSRPPSAPPSSAPPAAAKPPAAPSAREGTKTVAGHYPVIVSKQLKQIALDRETTVQELLREALNDFFRKNGRPPVA